MSSITLSQEEIREITHLQKPTAQIRYLKGLGIQAKKRPDNTVLVMRHQLVQAANDTVQQPTLKSARRS